MPGAVRIGPGADIAGALGAFARRYGHLDPADLPGPGAPLPRAAHAARLLAETVAGDFSSPLEEAVTADSVAWLVLRRLGADPAQAGLLVPPAAIVWGADPVLLQAAGTRIVRAAAVIAAHGEMLLSPLPPRPPRLAAAKPPPPAAVARRDGKGTTAGQPGAGGPPRRSRPVVPDRRPPAVAIPRRPAIRPAPDIPPRPAPDPDLVRANEIACDFFASRLPGSWAEAYLDKRGFGPALRRQWGLGYAPAGWGAPLLNKFRRAGLEEVAVAAGLAVRSSRTGTLTDLWRDRVIFPIHDHDGHLVAFGGRAPDGAPDGVPKYLNTPETVIYRKSEVLYGLHQARAALSAGARPVLTEGYTDVLATAVAGGGEYAGIATCSAALSDYQMLLLAAFCDLQQVPLLDGRDADRAGRKAAARDYRLIIPWCPQPVMPDLPDGADPAEVLKRDGPQALRAAFARTRPLADAAVDAVLDKWDRRRNWPDPETAHLVRPWDGNNSVGAVGEAGRLLIGTAWPDEPSSRQVARIALRTGQRYGAVLWTMCRLTLPPSLLDQDPGWDWDMYGPHAWEPSPEQMAVLAGAEQGEGKSRDPPAAAPPASTAAFPAQPHPSPLARGLAVTAGRQAPRPQQPRPHR